MPFYEYQCKHCGHTLEAMQKVSDAPLKKCPDCGKAQLQKLMSAPVFRLKGGGWYETDFKSDQDNKRNLADRPEAPETPKEDKKETTEAASKEAAAPDAATAGKSTDQPKEKGGEKPAEKVAAPAESARKPAIAGVSKRGAAKKPSSRVPAKRPVRHPIKRSAAKPARRR